MNNSKIDNIRAIQETLEIDDVFTNIDLNKHDIQRIEPYLKPFLSGCQNESPPLSEMIELCKKYSGIMECYIVNTDRDDTRISCEGITMRGLNAHDMCEIVNQYRYADELNLSNNNNISFDIRLWWD